MSMRSGLFVFTLHLAALVFISACNSQAPDSSVDEAARSAETTKPEIAAPAPTATSAPASAAGSPATAPSEEAGSNVAADNNVAIIETSMGTIKVKLAEEHAPNTVRNFKSLVERKFYDGTVFHRVIKKFMIQGGGFDTDYKDKGKREKVATIKMEKSPALKHDEGVIAMARTPDPDSASCQFYITVAPTPFLDDPRSPYAVFGKVIEGMDIAHKIEMVPTGTGQIELGGTMMPSQDVPLEPVVIKSIRMEGQI